MADDQNKAQENENKYSLKDEVIGIIKHDEVDHLIQRYLAHTKKVHRIKTITNAIVVLLGFLIGVGAFYLAYQSSANETVIATRRAYDQERAANIQDSVRRKIEWMKRIDSSIINMRKVRFYNIFHCKNNTPLSNHKQELMRFNARIAVVNTAVGAEYIFNQDLKDRVDELVAFDGSVKDVCAKDAPTDEKWHEYLSKINMIIGKSIKDDQDSWNKLGMKK